jgi:hypothetical protein
LHHGLFRYCFHWVCLPSSSPPHPMFVHTPHPLMQLCVHSPHSARALPLSPPPSPVKLAVRTCFTSALGLICACVGPCTILSLPHSMYVPTDTPPVDAMMYLHFLRFAGGVLGLYAVYAMLVRYMSTNWAQYWAVLLATVFAIHHIAALFVPPQIAIFAAIFHPHSTPQIRTPLPTLSPLTLILALPWGQVLLPVNATSGREGMEGTTVGAVPVGSHRLWAHYFGTLTRRTHSAA